MKGHRPWRFGEDSPDAHKDYTDGSMVCAGPDCPKRRKKGKTLCSACAKRKERAKAKLRRELEQRKGRDEVK